MIDPQATPAARPYMVSWRLHGRRVVIVGGGSIGTGKLETLLGTGALLKVVDPQPSERVRCLAAEGTISLIERNCRPYDLFRAELVVAATGESAINRKIRRWGRAAGALVNAVDDPDLCDITVPAVIRRGPATVAISTNGVSPAGARFLREHVSAALPPQVSDLLAQAGMARTELRRSGGYRYDYQRWKQELFVPGLALSEQGRDSAASLGELSRQFVRDFSKPHGSATPVPHCSGSVVLVGAGPGGADLITLRGARALADADVVLYDRLSDAALLDLAPPAALRIPVGKGKGFGHSQAGIGQLLVHHAGQGKKVVRLKGGDPFVFGRGIEEVELLAAAGVPVEVVPGVSSALAAPALAGISITDRRCSSGFTVLSGHRAARDDYDWSALARLDTSLVVLMASSSAARIAQSLIAAGRDCKQPVAFVHAAGTDHQKVQRAPLGAVARVGSPFPSPVVMVIGEVAEATETAETAETAVAYRPATSRKAAAMGLR